MKHGMNWTLCATALGVMLCTAAVGCIQEGDTTVVVPGPDGGTPATRDCVPGTERETGIGIGQCVLGSQLCGPDGRWGPSIGEGSPRSEICDAVDNDCDGLVDDGIDCRCDDEVEICEDRIDNNCNGDVDEGCVCEPGFAVPCGSDIGACVSGRQSCTDGTLGRCIGAVGPDSERCDGVDNNCDGLIDEGCSCTDGETQSCGTDTGECRSGTQTCVGGRWRDCLGELGPEPEYCDRRDNDCDGDVDESGHCECLDGTSRSCGTDIGACTRGTQDCVDGIWSVCAGGAIEPDAERCDGVDNDCDGSVDEGAMCECLDGRSEPCGTDLGACVSGTRMCVAGAWSICLGSTDRASETCDGLDNNCDGLIDEGCSCTDGDTQPCGSDLGECSRGTQACVLGRWDACVGEVGPAPESCDGLDNNCDGFIDNGPHCDCHSGATRPCGTNMGSCAMGNQTCVDGSWAACGGPGFTGPAPEVCNGADDDCNGTVDDGCPCLPGEFEFCGTNMGACVSGFRTCVAGTWTSCIGEVEPATEACDAVDNDCDGAVDEDAFCGCRDGMTQPCGTDVGLCTAGTQTCAAGVWGTCSGTGSDSEACDGLDNNCDGYIDEGCSCTDGATQPCGSDTGECSRGTQTCVLGRWAACAGEVGPATEACDGLDNDCDGDIDDGSHCTCRAGETRSCGTDMGSCTMGTQTCTAGTWGTCSGVAPSSEACDGVDNDCDGSRDEDCGCTSGDTRSCGTDLGACTTGAQSCTAGFWSVCSGTAPASEACNAVDDDCDGDIDEGCSCTDGATQACGSDLGECASGSQTCSGGRWGACTGEIGPAPESCDGLDNNCDGFPDNALFCECLTGATRACGTDMGVCEPGDQSCVAGMWTACSGASFVGPRAEICNGADDDCNGTVDDGCACLPGELEECGTDLGACVSGSRSCVAGTWSFCSDVGPSAEACNGIDDDCDGSVDEDAFCGCRDGMTQPCGSDMGVCVAGTQTCTAGVWGACSGTGPDSESCADAVDNDCDGAINEGCSCVDGMTQPCGSDTGECSRGVQTCSLGSWGACMGEVGPAPEGCDGLDNDCDGAVDDGSFCECRAGETRSCGTGMGECSIGSQTCVAGRWGICSGTAPDAELCDALDNDCDGSIDEDCGCVDGATQPCGTDLGICTTGTQTCTAGFWGACSGVMPASEACNGLDDNCDGIVDETCSCTDGATQPCGSDVGECVQGLQTCSMGRWGACLGEVSPAAETCDGRDNDCDADIDDGSHCECASGDSRACGTDTGLCTMGTQTCIAGHWAACSGISPDGDRCDGFDNDCDGSIDEGCDCMNGLVRDCGIATGACTTGTQTCNGGSWSLCSGTPPDAELCDAVDNDCDGAVDEDAFCGCRHGAIRTCGSDLGLCIAGVQACSGGVWGTCIGSTAPDVEACDGLDNNCDGYVDEGCSCTDGATQPCGSDTGECSRGVQTCRLGRWGACAGEVGPQPDGCDGLDNDCDGDIDEGAMCSCVSGATRSCGADIGACVAGTQTCVGGSWAACGGASFVGPDAELCNAVDDDCDGSVDEGGLCSCLSGQVIPCGSDLGECVAGTQTCVGGTWAACTGTGPSSETCDGLDNNCDGYIDETCSCTDGTTQPCGSDVGVCASGSQTCSGGRWGSCTGGIGPDAEACDGLDNDCDGDIDDGSFCECRAGESRPCGTDMGLCASGVQSCVAGRWGLCGGPGFTGPAPEVCNGADDDCNGTVDDGCPCLPGEIESCGTDMGACVSGTRSCVAGTWSACIGSVAPASESCDAVDNDCDGALDEDAFCGCTAGSVRPCGTDVGTCVAGTQTCAAGIWGTCSGIGPDSESCADTVDNDCDGTVNEGCVCVDGATQPCGTDVGECSRGMQTCVLGRWAACAGEVGPATEACDGLDNDCDGNIDDGSFCSCRTGTTRSCGTDLGFCIAGTQSCVDGLWGTCGGTFQGPRSETCNAIDDDCDGSTDEGAFCVCTDGATRACGTDMGACTTGTQTCVAGNWGLCSGIAPASETCDGVDNDCDGTIDDGLLNACDTCGPPPAEVCDGVDNDCDGAVDEGCSCVSGSSRVCGTDRGECTYGTQACVMGFWTSCSGIEPAPELCNGLDDNCDGFIDNSCR